jgi:hypothetical protein
MQLQWVGEQYRSAIGSYFESSPGLVRGYPKSLDALLDDKRFPVARHHLRTLFLDPFTDELDWVIIRAPDGGVMGIRAPHPESHGRSSEFVYVPIPAPR